MCLPPFFGWEIPKPLEEWKKKNIANSKNKQKWFFWIRKNPELRWKRTEFPLKINGWFRCIPYWNVRPFLGDMLVFRAVLPAELGTERNVCRQIYHNQSIAVSGSLNRWDRYHIIPQLAGKMPLIYHLYIAFWVIIIYCITYHLLREPETAIGLVGGFKSVVQRRSMEGLTYNSERIN